LSNRTQRVCVENCYSNELIVKSGVPQGSVLGPILFLLFINDIDRVCNSNSTIKLFADDLKIYSIFDISAMYNSSINYLQETINSVCLWADEWQLPINIRKCSALIIHKHSSLSALNPSYSINGVVLQFVDLATDLGVLIDDRLSYKSHINSIVSKALKRIGILFRGFLCRDVLFLRKAFVTYIRPVVEYCSVVWSPCFKKYIDLIEKVQKRFSKRIPCLRDLPYKERLSHLNLQSLELRRLHFDLIFYFNILNNNSPISKDDFFTFHFPPVSSRCPTPFIQKPRLSSKHLLSSFRYRSVDCWNSLTTETKNLSSINAFKKSLNKTDLSSFLYGSSFSSLSDFYISPLV
jgi:ribonucleases P/MRP protein subunit RPP40